MLVRAIAGLAYFAVGLALACVSPTAGAEPLVRVKVEGRVVKVPLEAYVESATASEIYSSWPRQVLRAQAVVARTYVLHESRRRSREPFDVESTVLSQRFGAEPVLPSVRQAVTDTRGEYLSFAGDPILAAFHSASGGRTASAEEVWGQALPYLRSVESSDDAAPDHFWSYEIAWSDLIEALRGAGLSPDPARGIELQRPTSSGRVGEIRIGGVPLTGRSLRSILGGRALRSAMFQARREGTQVIFMGSGSGHGVGLSQWGAREMAVQERSYREILNHYFPGAQLTSLRPSVATGGRSGAGGRGRRSPDGQE